MNLTIIFSVMLIDVRNPSELSNDGKIPGSFNIPLPDIEEAFKLTPENFLDKYEFNIPDKDVKNVVLSCR